MRILFAFFTLLGTIIGGGILSFPYVVYKLGIFPSLILAISVVILTYFSSLLLIKESLLMKGVKELPGIFEIYFDKRMKNFVFLLQTISIYGALIAYMIGISSTLNFVFSTNTKLIILPLFIPTAFIVYKGMSNVKVSEVLLTIIKCVLILIISFYLFFVSNKSLKFENKISFTNIIEGYGVFMFAFMCYSIIPNLKRFIKQEETLKRILLYALTLSFLLYFLFSIACISAYKEKTNQLITLSAKSLFEKILFSMLIIFLLITPYISLSWTLKDVFIFDYNMHYKKAWFLSTVLPFLVFLFFPLNFIQTIEWIGSIFGTILYFLLLLLFFKKH